MTPTLDRIIRTIVTMLCGAATLVGFLNITVSGDAATGTIMLVVSVLLAWYVNAKLRE